MRNARPALSTVADESIRPKDVSKEKQDYHTKLAEAFTNLEDPLCSLRSMARISYGLVADTISDQGLHMRLTGKPDCYYITKEEVDNVIFATSHVLTMVEKIVDDWYETK